jgi:hypothetical protein
MRPGASLLLVITFGARVVSACQCGRVPSPLEALPLSTAVFDGTVLRRTPVLLRVNNLLAVVEQHEFVVHEAWRGVSAEQIVLIQGLSNCSSRFQVGSRYLVFARPDYPEAGTGSPLTSSICLPTQPFEAAQAALADLGQGLRLAPVQPGPAESPARRRLRHLRASFLCGVGLTGSVFTFPSWAYEHERVIFFLGPAAVVFAFCALLYCAVRRRPQLFGVITLPVLALAAILLTAQGFLFIRYSMPLWWYLIDYSPVGA